MKRIKISSLSAACLNTRSVHKDWQGDENIMGEGADWEAWSAEQCEKCGKFVVLESGTGNGEHGEFAAVACDGYIPLFEGPMMNYWYPIGDPDDTAVGVFRASALKIAHLPLCIVKVEDQPPPASAPVEYGLALTGGGMDLTWEIVEAFTALGYLPPVHFAQRLPAICGRGTSPKDHYLMKACKRALIIEMRRLRQGMRTIAAAGEFGAKHEAERAARIKASQLVSR